MDESAPLDLGMPQISTLPALTCLACEGNPSTTTPLVAAWHLVRLAAKLFDDVEDHEARGQSSEIINVATGLLFAAQLALSAQLSSENAWHINQALQRAILKAAAGQHADLMEVQQERKGVDPDTWLEIAKTKSGELVAWAAWTGALVAGADAMTQQCLHQFGLHLGILLQVVDDLKDVFFDSRTSNWACGNFCLPVCYARFVAEGETSERLEIALQQAAQGDSTSQVLARSLMVKLGAQRYALVAAQVQYRHALAVLEHTKCDSIACGRLVALLNQILPAINHVRS